MILCVICLALLASDFFIHKHGHFEWDNWFGFSAVYGLASCLILVLGAKWFLPLVKRDEAYYD